jgi:large subunit ribosomal protein L22
MIAKAEVKHVRISPTKVRQVIDLIRDKEVMAAMSILKVVNKRPKECLIKLLKSVTANAKIKGFNAEQLYISKIMCNAGVSWKRYKAGAFGRAAPILKRTSHVKIEVDVKN